MFNYLINWNKIVKDNLPYFFRLVFRLDWITALIKPLKNMYAEFLTTKDDYIYKVAYTGQVIYLEKILNDKFDPVSRQIFISGLLTLNDHYLYRKIESKPPFYLYRKWDSSINYTAGQYSVEGNSVYKALIANTNVPPSSSPVDWVYHKPVTFLRRGHEYSFPGFIVHIPASLVFDSTYLNAIINYYRFATMQYTINLY